MNWWLHVGTTLKTDQMSHWEDSRKHIYLLTFQNIHYVTNFQNDEVWINLFSRLSNSLMFFIHRFADEMCVNYVHYFPKTQSLEVCKSAVDTEALNHYFDFLHE